MLSLHEIQNQFTHFVFRDMNQIKACDGIKSNGLSPEERLHIYRNNTQLGLVEALRETFPVVNKLVGTDFFNNLARSFIRQYPPTAGCLLFFGSEFPGYIACFKPAESLPYLSDVASLEWYWHEAFHEENAAALAVAVLTELSSENYGGLSFSIHPSARFLASDYPVLRIWQANQEGYEDDDRINLDQGGCRLMIVRPELKVLVMALNETEFFVLKLLKQELTLTQAVEQAISVDKTFNVAALLRFGFRLGLFTDYSITPTNRIKP